MLPEIEKVKGIHPGAILKRELLKRGLKNKDLAYLINEHAQTIGAILKEKRGINPNLSIKLGLEFGIKTDYFLLLQASYDVKKTELGLAKNETPNLKIIRKILFWDTDFNKIDWQKNGNAVIKRVFERGNQDEINEIIQFYGIDTIRNRLKNIDNCFLPSLQANMKRYKIDENI